MATKLKRTPGIAGQGNTQYIESMRLLRRSSATVPEDHGNRRIKSRHASKTHAIKFGY